MKGGTRPGAGRPTKSDKRIVKKMVRFTLSEWESVKIVSLEYGGRETDFMRNAILEKANRPQDSPQTVPDEKSRFESD